MKRKLVVHVGTHKTGSTSIQHMLDGLSASLEEHGVHVPVAARWQGHHAHLVSDLMYWRHNPCPRGWTDLADELTRCRASRFVVSAEHFTSPWAGRSMAARVAALARDLDLDVEVVGYVRPQHERLESSYSQQVKTGLQTAPFEDVLNDAPNDPRLNYNLVFEPWRKRFSDRLSVYPLEPDRMPDGLLAHFLTLLGVGDLSAAAAALPRMNTRVGAKQMEALRLASKLLSDQMIDDPAKSRLLAPVRDGLPALLEGDAPFAGLSADQVTALNGHFAESNARFAREYGIDAGGVLFRESPAETPVRPSRAAWENFSAIERARVRRFVRDTVGVELPPGDYRAGPRREHVKAWEFIRWMEPRAAYVAGHDWRSLALPSMAQLAMRRSVSVVVSAPAAPEALARTLAALERQTYPRHLVEVIVVDGSSTGALEPAAARNAGARAAAHAVLFFLDGGLMPEAWWLAAHARWHHAVSDVLTVGERAVVGTDDVSPDTMLLPGNPFGISRHFFDLLGGFDSSITDRVDQDAEFAGRASTRGGLLAPVREASCLDPVLPRPSRVSEARRRSPTPRFAVTVTAAEETARAAFETAARLLADAGPELVVLLDVPADGGATEWVRHWSGADSRVRFGSADVALDQFPAVPLHVRIPAGARMPGHLLRDLQSALGDAVVATLVLADGSRVSISRTWALHRARRTGRGIAHFGQAVRHDVLSPSQPARARDAEEHRNRSS